QKIERLPLSQQPKQNFLAVVDDDHVMALGLQVKTESLGDVALIFHNQDTAHTRYTLGRRMVNVLPWPSPSLSAKTSPPCRRTMERQRKRPKPVPLTWSAPRPCTR